MLVTLGIYRTTKLPNNFWRLHCYGVTILKRCNKPLLQISKTKIFDQKRFIKDSFNKKSQREKKFERFGNKSDNV